MKERPKDREKYIFIGSGERFRKMDLPATCQHLSSRPGIKKSLEGLAAIWGGGGVGRTGLRTDATAPEIKG